MNNKTEYRSIFKATTILGGVQLFNIIIGIARNKIVSILLGPSGMGIIGLLQSSSSTVSGLTSCGVSASSVKNVAMAYEEHNTTLLGKVIYTVKRLVLSTGTLATLILLVFCRKFSYITFGNYDFTLSFAYLSISLLFSQLTSAYQTIIKGCRYVKLYAKANVLGNFISFIISIPLYYVWGKNAIAPVLVIVSISTFVFAYYYQKKTGIREIKATKDEVKNISRDILKMGIPYACAEFFPILASYFIRLFVGNQGGVSDVGLYSAGFAILNGYVGMIFTAMSSDYIPRLSAISDNNAACERTINSQILLSILILLPILLLLIVFAKFIVIILYSRDFLPMIGMVFWGCLGMLLKTFNWCYGCILIPKRDSKIYLFTALLSAIMYLGSSVYLYSLWGLSGLGIAFFVSNTFDFLVAYCFVSKKYNIKLEKGIIRQLIVMSAVFLFMIYINTALSQGILLFFIEFLIVLGASIYSVVSLNRLMDLKAIIKEKLIRK